MCISQSLPEGAELRKGKRLPSWFNDPRAQTYLEPGWWQVYLDNFLSVDIRPKNLPAGIGAVLHSQALDSWQAAGVLAASGKDAFQARCGVELGVQLDGVGGLVGPTCERVPQGRSWLPFGHLGSPRFKPANNSPKLP